MEKLAEGLDIRLNVPVSIETLKNSFPCFVIEYFISLMFSLVLFEL